jgi:hypothetical protein
MPANPAIHKRVIRFDLLTQKYPVCRYPQSPSPTHTYVTTFTAERGHSFQKNEVAFVAVDPSHKDKSRLRHRQCFGRCLELRIQTASHDLNFSPVLEPAPPANLRAGEATDEGEGCPSSYRAATPSPNVAGTR